MALHGGFKGDGSTSKWSPHARLRNAGSPSAEGHGRDQRPDEGNPASAQWPAALTESWKEAKKNKENAVYAKIEMAGNECFEVPGCLDTENIMFEEGIGFRFPLKVKVTGPWLEKLGGGPCEIGNDENPIHINLTTSGTGRAGHLRSTKSFTNLVLSQHEAR